MTLQVDAMILCLDDPAESQQECVREIHLDSIRHDLHSLYQDEVLSDFTIKCQGKEFKVHKVLLASQSPVFKRMFVTDMTERRMNFVEISDIEPAVVSNMLTYIYTGRAPNLYRLAKELLHAANKYQLTKLATAAEKKLTERLDVDNVIETLIWANLLSKELKEACLRFIRLHYSDVKCSKGWQQLK